MKIIPKLFIILSFCACNIANVQSQIVERDLLLVNELDISRSAANNVSVDIKIKSENQRVADSINRNQVEVMVDCSPVPPTIIEALPTIK